MSQQVVETADKLPRSLSTGPGRYLREAREARRWLVENVARQLHLNIRIVRALEDDAYDQLPPPAFVRGYLQNYARLLGLSEHEILDAYKTIRNDHERRGGAGVLPTADSETSGPGLGQMAWFYGLLAVLLVGGWWYTHRGPAEPEESAMSVSSDTLALPPTMPNEPAAPAEPSSAPPLNPAPAFSSPPAAVQAQTEAMSAQGNATPATTAPADATPSRLPASNPLPTPAVGATVTEPAATLGDSTVSLRFSGDSWVTLIDADGKRLLFESVAAGATKMVQGKAPFKVTIGRPSNVQLEHNGQAAPIPYKNPSKPVRFTLGG